MCPKVTTRGLPSPSAILANTFLSVPLSPALLQPSPCPYPCPCQYNGEAKLADKACLKLEPCNPDDVLVGCGWAPESADSPTFPFASNDFQMRSIDYGINPYNSPARLPGLNMGGGLCAPVFKFIPFLWDWQKNEAYPNEAVRWMRRPLPPRAPWASGAHAPDVALSQDNYFPSLRPRAFGAPPLPYWYKRPFYEFIQLLKGGVMVQAANGFVAPVTPYFARLLLMLDESCNKWMTWAFPMTLKEGLLGRPNRPRKQRRAATCARPLAPRLATFGSDSNATRQRRASGPRPTPSTEVRAV